MLFLTHGSAFVLQDLGKGGFRTGTDAAIPAPILDALVLISCSPGFVLAGTSSESAREAKR